MNIFRLTFNTIKSTERRVEYNVSLNGTFIYKGKAFALPNATYVDVNLEDLLLNYRYRGEGSIKPKVDVNENKYVMEGYNASSTLADMWVTLKVYGSEFADISKTVKLYPDYPKTIELVSHIPANMPIGVCNVYTVYSTTDAVGFILKDGQRNSVTIRKGFNIINLGSEAHNFIFELNGNKTQVTAVDECMKPYYLGWLNANGSIVYRGFTSRSEASVDFNTNMRTDTYNSDWKANQSSQNKYKLKSTNLTDDEYLAYGEMFKSPYVVLLDTKNGTMEYVTITDETFNIKTRKTNDKKPVYLEVNVESAEHINI